MDKGKTVTFTDGSRLNMKTITENNDVMSIEWINLEDVIVTYDESFQMNSFGLDGNNHRVLSSMDALRRSINLYGQISPIIVSIIDENNYAKAIPHQRYQIVDGLKRYYIASNDGKEKIRAIVIHKEIKSAKSIIRFLVNQKVTRSPESIIDEARTVRSQTDDIRESFIEQILDLDFGSLEYLNNALKQSSGNKTVKSLIDKYRNGEITIKALVRKLDNLHEKESENDSKELSNDIKERTNTDKLAAQKGSDESRDLSDMKVRDDIPDGDIKAMDDHLDKMNKLDEDKALKAKQSGSGQDGYKERTVSDAESLLRSKQNNGNNQNVPEMNVNDLKEEKDDRQFVGERHPIPKSVRMDVLNRDDYKCQVCGRGGRTQPALVSQFQLHHMIDVQLGGVDDKDNLILLCEQCHALITKHKSFPHKPLPEWSPQYDPTTEELDENPNMWTIMVLSKIEQLGYKEVINQICNTDSEIGNKVKHYQITIGQAIKKLKNRLIIKHKLKPYETFQKGVINLYQEKAKLGYTIPNQKIREKAIEKYQENHR